ncbi:MAG: amidohydrolase family protein, partial [Clostridia bacterium]|nr:amidohydrolase family protein [Clostridia bacterium]
VNMKNHTGIGWPEAVRLGSHNPAKLLGIDGKTGSIEPGKDADIVIMDESAKVRAVIQKGRRIK